MLLFRPEYVDAILNGSKTETRRTWMKRRANVGSIHQCRTSYGAPVFARVRVLAVFEQKIAHMRDVDAIADGFEDMDAFLAKTGYTMDMIVWVVRFRVIIACPGCLSEKVTIWNDDGDGVCDACGERINVPLPDRGEE